MCLAQGPQRNDAGEECMVDEIDNSKDSVLLWEAKDMFCQRHDEPVHEISNNVVCGTSKGSDQPAHMRSLIRAFTSCLSILWTEHHFEFLSLKGVCKGSSKSTHVKMPHCWKSHALA